MPGDMLLRFSLRHLNDRASFRWSRRKVSRAADAYSWGKAVYMGGAFECAVSAQ